MLDIAIDRGRFPRAPVALLERAVRITLEAEGIAAAEVSLALLEDAGMRALNRDHLGHDGPTDVLAFALHGVGEPVLGDVYLGAAQARRQAAEEGIDETEELIRLAVHGTLHVLGWDHPDEAEERVRCPMWKRQEELVAQVVRPG